MSVGRGHRQPKPCPACLGRGSIRNHVWDHSAHGPTKKCWNCDGMGLSGGNWFTDGWNSFTSGVTDVANIGNEFTNPNSVLRSGVSDAAGKVANEFTNPDSLLRGTYLPEATQAVQTVTPFLQEIPGLGEVADVVDGVATGLNYAQKANQAAKAIGMGKPRRHRVVSQHTSSRNKVVRQVMAEKNMKMIEASKYVKTHGLWKR